VSLARTSLLIGLLAEGILQYYSQTARALPACLHVLSKILLLLLGSRFETGEEKASAIQWAEPKTDIL